MSIENTQTSSLLTTTQRTNRIKQEVAKAGDDLRARYPLLRQTDLLGVLILLVSIGGMVGSGALYLTGLIPWWVCVPVTAFFASFTHELEHDLIHMMYFRKRALPRNLMMALVWLARPSTINPWIRRKLHLHHHLHSGTETDIEERAITNGETWGLRRFVMTGDNALAIVLRLHRAPSAKLRLRMFTRGLIGYFPLGWLNWGAWHVFLGFHAIDIAARFSGHPLAWSAGTLATMQIINIAVVVLVAPNVLRTFCLHFISSNMHYYGDIEDGNVTQQCQVLNPWWLLPLQAFCCNFGSSHAIHHFVVKEPFYIRQLTVPRAHAVMREMGVRFNDFGTFRRANRFLGQTTSRPVSSGMPQAA